MNNQNAEHFYRTEYYAIVVVALCFLFLIWFLLFLSAEVGGQVCFISILAECIYNF